MDEEDSIQYGDGRKVEHGGVMAAIKTTTLRFAPEDIALAKKLAEIKGMKYQTYIKSLIHQELMRISAEEKNSEE